METDIDAAGVHSGSYTRTFGYDAYGRLESLGYPSGSTFTLAYNGQGYAHRLKCGTTVLEEVQDSDAFGQATVTAFANGLKTVRGYDPATGRLTSIQTGPTATPKSIQDLEYAWRSNSTLYKRLDKRNTTSTTDDYTDAFSYDALERLTAQATTVGASRTLDFGYDAYGNLTSKTSNVTNDLDVTGYGYGISGKPHRLASVTIGTVVNTLTYDANGSITNYNAASGDDIDLVYDGQNNVTSITVGATPTAKDEFWYDPDGQRFLGQETWQSSGTKSAVTVYLGDFEEVIPAAGSDKTLVQRTDLSAGVRHIRVRYASNGTYNAWFEYLHRDHLGSVAVVTNAAGTQLIDKLSYDPFGGRRRDTWASDITTTGMNSILANEDVRFARGFTDHEMLNRTGFIHMNGRVYDPRIGRFVSADPIVQAPFHSQSYNRYAYVFNSPLSYTDPSGYFIEGDLSFFGIILGNSDFGWAWERGYGSWKGIFFPAAARGTVASMGIAGEQVGARVLVGACAVQPELCPAVVVGVVVIAGAYQVYVIIDNNSKTETTAGYPTTAEPEPVMSEGASDEPSSDASAEEPPLADDGGKEVVIGDKIRSQLPDRGWTEDQVRETARGPKTGTSIDNTEGKAGDKGEPASVYGTPKEHVIVNDKTGKVIQATIKNVDWLPDDRIDWF